MKVNNFENVGNIVTKELTGWVSVNLPYDMFEVLFEGATTKEQRSQRYKELTFSDYANEDGEVQIKFQEKGGDTVAFSTMPLDIVGEIFLSTNSRYLVNAKLERELGKPTNKIVEVEPA